MFKAVFIPLKKVKQHIISNRKMYLLSSVVAVVGIMLGIYLVLGEFMEAEIYTTTDLSLSEIILGERSSISLFFQNLWALILPFILIFLLWTNNYTKYLSFFYLGFQGILLGASLTSLILEKGIAGALNSLLIVLPINLMNFFVLISWLVVCHKKLAVSKLQHLSAMHSIKLFMPQIIGCVLGALFASFVYGFVYPLLLKTVIIVNAW